MSPGPMPTSIASGIQYRQNRQGRTIVLLHRRTITGNDRPETAVNEIFGNISTAFGIVAIR